MNFKSISLAFDKIIDRLSTPLISNFYLYLILLWLLNIADIVQTLMLKQGGHLKKEANIFIDYFLAEDERLFIIAKLSALVFISAMLIRGYYDQRGTTIAGKHYSSEEMRRAILLLLSAGVVYYLFIVLMPFLVVFASHYFTD